MNKALKLTVNKALMLTVNKALKLTVNKALFFHFCSLLYFSNVGHAFQPGLVTGVLPFNSFRLLLRIVFTLHQLYIRSYFSKTIAPYHVSFHQVREGCSFTGGGAASVVFCLGFSND